MKLYKKNFAKTFTGANSLFMSSEKTEFTERLRRVVDRAGGIGEVARIAGVSTQAVYGWLAGSKPYKDRATRICLALGISEKWLWKGEGPESDADDDRSVSREESRHSLERSDETELHEKLAEMINSFRDVPPAFVKNALSEISQHFVEFRRRAEIRISKSNGKK